MQQTCILFRYIYGGKMEMTREELNIFYQRYRVRLHGGKGEYWET